MGNQTPETAGGVGMVQKVAPSDHVKWNSPYGPDSIAGEYLDGKENPVFGRVFAQVSDEKPWDLAKVGCIP
jgi:hypothetical protein